MAVSLVSFRRHSDGTFTGRTLMALVGMVKSKVLQDASDAAAQVNTSWFKLDHVLPTLRSGFWSVSDSVAALLRRTVTPPDTPTPPADE